MQPITAMCSPIIGMFGCIKVLLTPAKRTCVSRTESRALLWHTAVYVLFSKQFWIPSYWALSKVQVKTTFVTPVLVQRNSAFCRYFHFLFRISEGIKFKKPLKDKEVFEKDPVVLQCEISEDIPVQWYHNGEQVVLGEKAIASSEGFCRTLMLPWCAPSDAGVYSVAARFARSSAELTVKGVILFSWCCCLLNFSRAFHKSCSFRISLKIFVSQMFRLSRAAVLELTFFKRLGCCRNA